MNIFSIFFNMKACCVFSLECHYQYKKEISHQIIPNIIMAAAMGFFPRDSRTNKKAVVIEPSVFEPLKLYCI